MLFGFNRGIRPFYTACHFNELNRVSVLCLLNASFEKRFHHATTRFFTPKSKFDDHGVRRGDTGRILVQWWRPIASKVALDLPYWVMCSEPYHLIRMAIEMVREVGAFFSVVDFMACINVAKHPWPWYGQLKIKPSYTYTIVHHYEFSYLVRLLWRPADSNECCFGYHCRRRASDYIVVIYTDLTR